MPAHALCHPTSRQLYTQATQNSEAWKKASDAAKQRTASGIAKRERVVKPERGRTDGWHAGQAERRRRWLAMQVLINRRRRLQGTCVRAGLGHWTPQCARSPPCVRCGRRSLENVDRETRALAGGRIVPWSAVVGTGWFQDAPVHASPTPEWRLLSWSSRRRRIRRCWPPTRRGRTRPRTTVRATALRHAQKLTETLSSLG